MSWKIRLPICSLEEEVSSDQYQNLYRDVYRLKQLTVLENSILLQVPAVSNLLNSACFIYIL